MSPAPPSDTPARYTERLHVPVGWWVGILAMTVILGLEIVPLLPVSPWVTVGVPVLLVVALLASASTTKVEVADGAVRAGKWQISCAQVASVEELDQRNTRRFAGVAGDPAAVTLVRPWIKSAARIVCVTDDPPYGLISSRHPERLSAAVVACASRAAEG